MPFIFRNAISIKAILEIAAITVQSQNSEIFQVGKRNIINQKMIDKWGNANIALPRPF
jgi:3-deoxy-D-arabino-heptulosonate 7-phosphate (DAHP) synthase